MNYSQRLVAAAKYVYSADSTSSDGGANINPADYGVAATLKPHQIEGVAWLIRRYHLGVNVILGDEMGLGKTLQAASLLSYLKISGKSPGPFLVLCPLSVTDSWMSEVAKFAPKLSIISYVGDKEHRRGLRKKLYEHVKKQSVSAKVPSLHFDVLLTTYDIALIDQDFLSQIPWHYAIIDEAQRLKNPSSVLYNVLLDRYVMPRKLLMTGTPIQNNITELWALMRFCLPTIFGTSEQFFSAFKEAGDPQCHDAEKAKSQFKLLKYVLAAFMLRRTKSKLSASGDLVLPPLTEITVMVPLVALQKKVYMSILKKELPMLLALASGTPSSQSLQNIVIQLRKACSHPYLFPGIEPEPYEEGEHLVQASGKLLILDQLLKKLHDSGHRVLLFAQMTQTLDILQDFLELRKYLYERLDGSIRAEERFSAIRSFSKQPAQSDKHSAFVFLISTRAGGVGLNLVAADTVIFYEQDWNPQVDKQALQRAHRIGQVKHVLSINLVTEQTVEEVIKRRAERKLQLSHNVVGDDTDDQQGKSIVGAEAGDLRSVVLGLHLLDPVLGGEYSDEKKLSGLTAMAERVILYRQDTESYKDDQKFEINQSDIVVRQDAGMDVDHPKFTYDPGLDEASYNSWVRKFKEESRSHDDIMFDLRNKCSSSDDRNAKAKVARKKAEEKKFSKWEASGYHSLSLNDPEDTPNRDIMSGTGAVHYVYGDCTLPSKLCPTESAVIFSCVDNSGRWGHGGLFDALAKVSEEIPNAYERASEFGDLHLGDVHLIEISGDSPSSSGTGKFQQFVALAIVQSYNPRRKVPRSNISIPDLEQCLSKAARSAADKSASIHMPRIGYQDNSDRSEWYAVERLLRKYTALYNINIYVYYFRSSS